MLEFLKLSYDEVVYDFVKDQQRVNEELTELPFFHLPYLIDDENRICNFIAILRYLGRKGKLLGKTEDEQVRTEMLEQQLVDMQSALHKVVYDKHCHEVKNEYLIELPTQLALLAKFFGDNSYSTGHSIVYVDFFVYNYLVQIRALLPTALRPYPNLLQFIDRIENLPRLVKYTKSRKPRALYSPKAIWNALY